MLSCTPTTKLGYKTSEHLAAIYTLDITEVTWPITNRFSDIKLTLSCLQTKLAYDEDIHLKIRIKTVFQ